MAINKKARGSSRHGGNKDKQAAGSRKSAPRRGSARAVNDLSAREGGKGSTKRGGTANRQDDARGRVRGNRNETGSAKTSGRRGTKNNSSQRSVRVNKRSAPQQKGGSRRTGGGRTGTARHAARR